MEGETSTLELQIWAEGRGGSYWVVGVSQPEGGWVSWLKRSGEVPGQLGASTPPVHS